MRLSERSSRRRSLLNRATNWRSSRRRSPAVYTRGDRRRDRVYAPLRPVHTCCRKRRQKQRQPTTQTQSRRKWATLYPETGDFVAENGEEVAKTGDKVACFLIQTTKSPVSGDKVAAFGNKCGQAIRLCRERDAAGVDRASRYVCPNNCAWNTERTVYCVYGPTCRAYLWRREQHDK